jgi:hypothetical protein
MHKHQTFRANTGFPRKPSLIFWKPLPPNLIPGLARFRASIRNLFVNSVLARIADWSAGRAE